MKKLLILVLAVLVLFAGGVWVDPFGFSGSLSYEEEERFTRLQVSNGEVLVNGQLAVDGQILSAGDLIKTARNTQASVLYFDDSVTRLSADTEVKLEILNSEDYYSGEAEIKLLVNDGEAWTNVPPQTAKKYLFGVSTRDVHATIRGTTLNVLVEADTSVIQAANHSIEVRPADQNSGEQSVVLREGEEIEYGQDTTEEGVVPKQIGVRRVIPEKDLKRDWFAQNSQEDQFYEKALLADRLEKQKQNVGALPGTVGYRIKKVREAVQVKLASDTEKKQLEKAVLERRFAEAQILQQEGEKEAAKVQLDRAKDALQRASQTDKAIAEEILVRQQEIVKTALPGDAAYDLKQDLRAFEVRVTSDAEKEGVEQQHLQRSILELHDAEKDPNADTVKIKREKQVLRTKVNALPLEVKTEIAPALPYILDEEEVEKIIPSESEEASEVSDDFGTQLSEEEVAELEAAALGTITNPTEVPDTPVLVEPVEETPEVEEEISSNTGSVQISVTPGGVGAPKSSNDTPPEIDINQDTLDQIKRDLGGFGN